MIKAYTSLFLMSMILTTLCMFMSCKVIIRLMKKYRSFLPSSDYLFIFIDFPACLFLLSLFFGSANVIRYCMGFISFIVLILPTRFMPQHLHIIFYLLHIEIQDYSAKFSYTEDIVFIGDELLVS